MTTVTTAAIRVNGLEKSFKDLHVLRGVDFDVAPGQHLRPARLERRGQDHRHSDPVHPAQAGCRHRGVSGFDVATQAQDVRESISLTGSSPPSTRSSAGARTSCWSRSCGT